MQEIKKNIRKAEALKLKDELQYQEGQVVSKTLIQNDPAGRPGVYDGHHPVFLC